MGSCCAGTKKDKQLSRAAAQDETKKTKIESSPNPEAGPENDIKHQRQTFKRIDDGGENESDLPEELPY